MATIKRNSTATANSERTTNYTERMYAGVKYKSVDLAVQAAAKDYALKELKLVAEVVAEVAPQVESKAILQSIYDIKKANIMASIERHDERDNAFADLAL